MIGVVFFLLLSIASAVVYAITHHGEEFQLPRLILIVFLPIVGWLMELIDHYVQPDKDFTFEDDRDNAHQIVMSVRLPHMQDAFPLYTAVDDTSVFRRRDLMKEAVLSPDAYFNALTAARMDSDTEVVHYATTALVQLRDEATTRLEAARDAWRDNPDDPARRDDYQNALQYWLDGGFSGRQHQKLIQEELNQLLATAEVAQVQ